jgi:hypothetical protein
LLARQTADGISFGATPVDARGVEKVDSGREHEVVAVLRPEEAEIAPTPETLSSPFIARGTVEEIVFTGAHERIRIRLTDGVAARLIGPDGSADSGVLEATRSQHEQRSFAVAPGEQVAIGMRRVHVLPTPLSSFTACATTTAGAERLSRHPFLVDLATRMKTRVAVRVEAALASANIGSTASGGDSSGVAVLESGPKVIAQMEWLFDRGAAEALVLPAPPTTPQRVLIHWLDRAARRGTLAVAASLLRHVSAEAVYFGIMPEETTGAARSLGMRTLLDARSEAQAVHGLEMRTELRFGDIARELEAQLAASRDQMLILGVSDLTSLRARFSVLFSAEAGWPILVVYRPHDAARRE